MARRSTILSHAKKARRLAGDALERLELNKTTPQWLIDDLSKVAASLLVLEAQAQIDKNAEDSP